MSTPCIWVSLLLNEQSLLHGDSGSILYGERIITTVTWLTMLSVCEARNGTLYDGSQGSTELYWLPDQVLERANATEYGLAAGVFTQNLNWATTLSRGLKAGTVWVNTWNVFDAGVPFGGYKLSDIGREHGEAALAHYTQVSHCVCWVSHYCPT